ncbi:hypothetical protein PRZ48_002381 [Zasmidium cellare]|uniref:Heterokaryon incompatibility domain-containing protein n=1 Tax=Zasmidium cellare TaxID=395010 RepID=A0ABR0F4K4_ZASCE|nr:hypothetical protein PRZ48_002381 [Zasmidium cellare]
MSDVLEPSAASPPNHYVYETIDSSSIRLLTLAPSADPASRIEVLIQHCKRTENPGYAAISYTWGEEEANHAIYCDGSVIKVTKGCDDALRALRHASLPHNLWIDAVCINQGDLEERTQQVAVMGEVYRRASETFGYLGESHRSYDIYDPEMAIEKSEWVALLERPWFTRTWVIQELMLSKRMTLVIGRQMLALSDLLSLCAAKWIQLPALLWMRNDFVHDYARRPPKSWDEAGVPGGDEILDRHEVQQAGTEVAEAPAEGIGGNDEPVETSDKGKQPARDVKRPIEETPRRTQEDDLPSKESGHINLNYWMLHDILRQTAGFGCRDPRDKLFAILPLFKKPIPALLYPDYKKTTQEVFTDLSWFLLQQELPQCLEYARGPNDEGLPSWATDWSRGLPWLSFEDDKAVSERVARWRKSWRAGFQAGAREIRSTRVDSRTISLRGLTVGKVVRTQRKRCFYFELDAGDGKRLTSVIWALRQKLDGRSDFQCKTGSFNSVAGTAMTVSRFKDD